MVNGVLEVVISEVLTALLLMIRLLITGGFQSTRDELIHGPHTEHLVTQGMSRFKSAPADGNPDMRFLVLPHPLKGKCE